MFNAVYDPCGYKSVLEKMGYGLVPVDAGASEGVARTFSSQAVEQLRLLNVPDNMIVPIQHQQSPLQLDYIRLNYGGAELDLLRFGGELVGRLFVHPRHESLHLIDFALLPGFRGQGHGERLLRGLMESAGEQGKEVTLLAEMDGRACQLYRRVGFQPGEPFDLFRRWWRWSCDRC